MEKKVYVSRKTMASAYHEYRHTGRDGRVHFTPDPVPLLEGETLESGYRVTVLPFVADSGIWEPKDTFEEVFVEIDGMDFGLAIEAAKMGRKIARKGWNGKSQYVELATNISYVNAAGETVNADHAAIGNKALAFVGTSGVQIGWLASQADMLAEDWYIVE